MKPIYQSKTFWLNVLALLCLLSPAVQAWMAANPEQPVMVLGALNILVRFVTQGKITIFASGDNDTASKWMPVCVLGVVTAGLCMALQSCSPAQLDALKGIPISGAVDTDYGSVGYSSKSGVSLYVDRRSRK
jgi:hypothetical protein